MSKSKSKYVPLYKPIKKFDVGGIQPTQDQLDQQQAQTATNDVNGMTAKVPVYGQLAAIGTAAEGMSKAFIPKNPDGSFKSNNGKAVNDMMTPVHEQVIGDMTSGHQGRAVADAFGIGTFARGYLDSQGKANSFWETTGTTSNLTKDQVQQQQNQQSLNNQQPQQQSPNQQQFINNQMKYGGYKYPMGGQVPRNQSTAEVEGGEVGQNAQDGQTTNFNGPSHSQGGIPIKADGGDRFFSDRLKDPKTKKTFADLAKKYPTSKYQKLIDDKKTPGLTRETAGTMLKNNKQALDNIFNKQESQKSTNFAGDLFAFGGQMMYKDGGIHIQQSHKNLFNNAAKASGQSVQDYAHKILQHKQNFTKFANGGQQALDYMMNYRMKNQKFDIGGAFNNSASDFITNNNGVDPSLAPSNQNQVDDGQTNLPGFGGSNGPSQSAINTIAPVKQYGNNNIFSNSNFQNPAANQQQNKPYFNSTQNTVAQAGVGALNSLAPLTYMAQQGKRYDTQQMHTYKPQNLNPNAALRDIDQTTAANRQMIPGMSNGSGATAIQSLLANKLQGDQTKAGIRSQYENTNVGINNQGKEFNIGNQFKVDDINAQNKGKALTNFYGAENMAAQNTGKAISQGINNQNVANSDQMRFNSMDDFYANYTLDKPSGHWIPNTKKS